MLLLDVLWIKYNEEFKKKDKKILNYTLLKNKNRASCKSVTLIIIYMKQRTK